MLNIKFSYQKFENDLSRRREFLILARTKRIFKCSKNPSIRIKESSALIILKLDKMLEKVDVIQQIHL